MDNPKAIKSVIVGDLEQDVIQVFFLNDEFEPIKDMASIPLNLGYYEDKIDDYSFYISKVVLKPKDVNDLKLTTMDDFEKFNFEILDCGSYNLIDENGEKSCTIEESMKSGDFWLVVKDICLTDKPFDKEIKEV